MSIDPSTGYAIGHSTPTADHDTVTLSTGTTFLIVRTDGSISPGGIQGFYVEDTRLLSLLRLTVDGEAPRVVRTTSEPPTLRVAGTVGDPTRPHLLVQQELCLTGELTMTISLENLTSQERSVSVDLAVTTDFADLFDVKRGLRPRGGMVTFGPLDDDLILRYQNGPFRRGVRVHVDAPDDVMRDGIHVRQQLPARGTAVVTATMTPVRSSRRRIADAARLQRRWEEGVPASPAPDVPERIWHRSWSDLGMLLMPDPEVPDDMVVAAGSPWFMALFGRDSLITSWQTLPYRTDLAIGVLRSLAARQGQTHDPTTLEQPGRIAHESRQGEVVQRADGWGSTFYGTVDATPLFVMTLHRAWRCGALDDDVRALVPAAAAAIGWIVADGDADGDGFVEYPGIAHSPAGLDNQGWKDSHDAIRHPDGSLAQGPIALVEVQGYCHAAFLALADLHEHFDTGDAGSLRQRAARLEAAIDDHFWLDELDCYALALDGEKRPVATVSSNAGHLLFTGTARPDRAERLVRRLMEDDMFTGFGVRTLSSTNAGYNPLSYHCGSVWPHDTALVAAGMMRVDPASGRRVARALLDAAEPSGRLPELFGGFARSQHPCPVPYPTSCSPQAWSAGAPLLLASELAAAARTL